MKKVAQLQAILKEKLPEGTVVARHSDLGHFYEYTPNGELYASVTTKTSILGSDHLKMWAVNESLKYLELHWSNITLENRSEHFRAAQLAHVSTFEDAGDIGTKVHGIIEDYLKAWMANEIQPADIRSFIKDEDVRLYALTRSAEAFFNDFHVIPIASEMKIASPKHKYGGTMDALLMVGKVVSEGNANRTGFEKCHHMWSETKKHVECFHCGRKLEMTLILADWKSSNSVLGKDAYAQQISAYASALRELTGIKVKDLWVVRLDKEKAKYEVVRVVNPVSTFKSFLQIAKVYDWQHDGISKLYPVVEKEIIKI